MCNFVHVAAIFVLTKIYNESGEPHKSCHGDFQRHHTSRKVYQEAYDRQLIKPGHYYS